MKYFSLFFMITLLFSSCSRIPEPIGYEYSTQQKMQAAHHWNVLAKDLSNRINNELIRSDFLETSVYVQETCGSDSEPCNENETTTFNEGFRDLLITDLVNYGIPTSSAPDREAITIHYKVQTIHHTANRVRTLRPGALTALTTFVSVIRNAPKELIAISLAGVTDYANSTYVRNEDMEIIITTSMVFRNKYFFRSSDIYYINSEDYHHYKENESKSKTIELISSTGY